MTQNAKTVNEQSPLCITLTFTDENGDPLIPSTVDWRLDDTELDAEVVGWTPLISMASTMTMTIAADNNVIVNESKTREARMYGVRINNTMQSEAHAEFKYHVLNLVGPSGA